MGEDLGITVLGLYFLIHIQYISNDKICICMVYIINMYLVYIINMYCHWICMVYILKPKSHTYPMTKKTCRPSQLRRTKTLPKTSESHLSLVGRSGHDTLLPRHAPPLSGGGGKFHFPYQNGDETIRLIYIYIGFLWILRNRTYSITISK